MKQYNLLGKVREISTKGAISELRNKGFVPGVLYKMDKSNENFYCFINDLNGLIVTSEVFLVNLKIDNKIYKSVVKDVQNHPLTDQPIHVDFMEVDEDKVIKTVYPINFIGTPVGARQGGKVLKKLLKIRLQGQVKNMPKSLDIDISELKVGDTLKIKDIVMPELTILEQSTQPIITVSRTRGTAAEGSDEKS